jgi:hypothetical protein
MSTPEFRQLSEEEVKKLSLDEQLEYMKQLMAHVKQKLADARKTLDEREQSSR